MTNRQSWAIKCASGLDVRDVDLSYESASLAIKSLNESEKAHGDTVAWLQQMEAVGTPKGFSPYKGKTSRKKATRKSKATKKVTKTGESTKDRQNRELWERAVKAGEAAVEEHEAVPMHVVQRANPLDDSSPVVKAWKPVSGGVCGFSWTVIKDGRTSFARWLVKNGHGKTSEYYGGVIVWGEDTKYSGQSMSAKEAYTSGLCEVLREAGVEFQTYSRLD